MDATGVVADVTLAPLVRRKSCNACGLLSAAERRALTASGGMLYCDGSIRPLDGSGESFAPEVSAGEGMTEKREEAEVAGKDELDGARVSAPGADDGPEVIRAARIAGTRMSVPMLCAPRANSVQGSSMGRTTRDDGHVLLVFGRMQ